MSMVVWVMMGIAHLALRGVRARPLLGRHRGRVPGGDRRRRAVRLRRLRASPSRARTTPTCSRRFDRHPRRRCWRSASRGSTARAPRASTGPKCSDARAGTARGASDGPVASPPRRAGSCVRRSRRLVMPSPRPRRAVAVRLRLGLRPRHRGDPTRRGFGDPATARGFLAAADRTDPMRWPGWPRRARSILRHVEAGTRDRGVRRLRRGRRLLHGDDGPRAARLAPTRPGGCRAATRATASPRTRCASWPRRARACSSRSTAASPRSRRWRWRVSWAST